MSIEPGAAGAAWRGPVLVLLGGFVGGVVGYFLFYWIAMQGFYALAVPGGMVGLGAGFTRNRSLAVAMVCGVMALAFGLFSEWRLAPFAADESLAFFLAHVHKLRPMTLIMIAVGAILGFWVPFRSIPRASASAP